MKKLFTGMILVLFSMSSYADISLSANTTLNNTLSANSSTSAFSEVNGNGSSYSISGISTRGLSTGTTLASTCPKQGHSVATTSLWGNSTSHGSNYSTGDGAGGAFASGNITGSANASAINNADVSIWRQSWTGESIATAASEMDLGSVVSVGTNTSGQIESSFNSYSTGESSWKVDNSGLTISDTKDVSTDSDVSTNVSSWNQGSNVLGTIGWASGSNTESATAEVNVESTRNMD
jgi:hypothetical protein